jgi:BirA family biotin operon repressor/biotin-[acetyl-CoA-carboxylase] ligase
MLRQISLPEGSVFYSFDQQKGRGQRGNEWLGEPNKNVAFSLILTPQFLAADQQFYITKMISLAVADLMSDLIPLPASEIYIKWPNDIYIRNKKIGGILIENILKGQIIQYSVVGIGLNINQVDFPIGLNSATSVKIESGKETDLTTVINLLCEKIEGFYLIFRYNYKRFDEEYLKRLYRYNAIAKFRLTSGEELEGTICGVTSSGKLQLKELSGNLSEFDLKEIQFI